MKTAVKAIGVFLLATIAAYPVVLIAGFTLLEITGASQREGAAAMGVAFMIGPALSLLTGLIAAVIYAARASARAPPPPDDGARI